MKFEHCYFPFGHSLRFTLVPYISQSYGLEL
jgi:hypothetical protein